MIFGLLPTSDPEDVRRWRSWSDEELVRNYQAAPHSTAGKAAVTALLGRYQSRVFQWCRSYVREPEAALDLAQEVLVNAYRGLAGFDGDALFSSWLFAVARNRCLSAVRRRGPDRDDDTVLEQMAAPGPAPDAHLERRQQQEALRARMRGLLSEREEEAVWLRVIERMSVDQITAVLGLGNATGARSLLQNARRKLRGALGGRADPFGEDD